MACLCFRQDRLFGRAVHNFPQARGNLEAEFTGSLIQHIRLIAGIDPEVGVVVSTTKNALGSGVAFRRRITHPQQLYPMSMPEGRPSLT